MYVVSQLSAKLIFLSEDFINDMLELHGLLYISRYGRATPLLPTSCNSLGLISIPN